MIATDSAGAFDRERAGASGQCDGGSCRNGSGAARDGRNRPRRQRRRARDLRVHRAPPGAGGINSCGGALATPVVEPAEGQARGSTTRCARSRKKPCRRLLFGIHPAVSWRELERAAQRQIDNAVQLGTVEADV